MKSIFGLRLAARGLGSRFTTARSRGLAAALGHAAGVSLRPAARQRLPQPHRPGEPGAAARSPAARARSRSAWSACSSLFPRLEERRRQAAGHDVGRRAPDGRDGPRADARAPRSCSSTSRRPASRPPSSTRSSRRSLEVNADGRDDPDGRAERARALSLMSDRGYVLDLGTNRFEGPGPELIADPKVAELYLGGGARTRRRRRAGCRRRRLAQALRTRNGREPEGPGRPLRLRLMALVRLTPSASSGCVAELDRLDGSLASPLNS